MVAYARQFFSFFPSRMLQNTRKASRRKVVDNDASARLLNLSSALCDLDVWPSDPKVDLFIFHALDLWTTRANRHPTRFQNSYLACLISLLFLSFVCFLLLLPLMANKVLCIHNLVTDERTDKRTGREHCATTCQSGLGLQSHKSGRLPTCVLTYNTYTIWTLDETACLTVLSDFAASAANGPKSDYLNIFTMREPIFNPLIATLKPQSKGPSYSNTVIGTLADDGWAVTLARRDWAGPQPAQAPPRCTKCNSPFINGQCTNFVLFDVAQ